MAHCYGVHLASAHVPGRWPWDSSGHGAVHSRRGYRNAAHAPVKTKPPTEVCWVAVLMRELRRAAAQPPGGLLHARGETQSKRGNKDGGKVSS